MRSIVPAITLGSPSVSNRIKTGDMIQFPFACQFGKAKVSLCFQEAVTGFRLSKVEENGAFCLQTVTLSISPFSAVSVILYSFLLCVVLFSFCFFFLLVTHVCLLVYRSSCHLKERHERYLARLHSNHRLPLVHTTETPHRGHLKGFKLSPWSHL